MVKRGRPVVLHKKVRDPRPRARNRERQRKPPPAPQRHGRYQQRRSRQRAREVNRARAGLTVRSQIFAPEVCEVCFALHRHWTEMLQTEFKRDSSLRSE